MRICNDTQWKSVTYQSEKSTVPEERWGHSFAKVSEVQIVMFGGYGSSSQEDLNRWEKINTSGDRPQPRSNYTIHFNDHQQQLIIFGGGSQKKVRFNDICILNWQTKIWRKIHPNENKPSPWERTYHTSQFIYPYLIIHGGESLNSLDLEDMWVFDIQSEQWRLIQFSVEGQQVAYPCARRFHSSVFFDNCFYIFGGCKDTAYFILNDIYKVDLGRLLQKQEYNGYHWELILQNNEKIKKWGQSSEIYEGKIYITCGRVSSSADTNQTFVFDPLSKTINEYQNINSSTLKARRRHSSVIVGNSLLIFGGYNGKYLNEFHYLPLKAIEEEHPSTFHLAIQDQKKGAQEEMNNHLKKRGQSISLKVIQNQKELKKIKVGRAIRNNQYFDYLLNQHRTTTDVRVELPTFVNLSSFEALIQGIMTGIVPIFKEKLIDNCKNILRTAEYFCCFDLLPEIETLMINNLNNQNCQELYQFTCQLQLPRLKQKAALTYLSSHNYISGKEMQAQGYLTQLSQKMKFDIDQTKLRDQQETIFSKAASTLKDILTNRSTQSESLSITTQPPQKQKTISRFTKFVTFVQNICMRTRVEPQNSEN